MPGATVTARFRDRVRDQADEVALRAKDGDRWVETTWGEYGEQAARVAGGLRELGVGEGDRVLLMLRNRVEFHVVDLGVLLLRATPISVYNSSSPEQLQYLAQHSRAKVAVVEADFLERLQKVRAELEDLQAVVVLDPDESHGEDVVRYESLLEAEPVDTDAAADAAQPDDLLTVIYTSGTTGPPKGVMMTQANAVAEADIIYESVVQRDATGWDVISYLPMAHIAERVVSHYGGPLVGIVATSCPDPTQVGAYLREVRPDAFFGPPRIWEKMKSSIETTIAAQGEERRAGFQQALEAGKKVDQARRRNGGEVPSEHAETWEQLDAAAFAPLRQMLGLDDATWLLTAAAPIPVEVIEFFRACGLPLSECWGMSETTGGLTWSHWDYVLGSVGRPAPGCEVRIADDGELLCRGPNVTTGYLDEPEKTAEALDDDGWLHTGDVARVDDDGYVYLVDRKKELIITAGGKNVSPANVEAALKGIPLVGQAAVVGDGRPYLVALLTLDPDAAEQWARSNGKDDVALEDLADDPDVLAEVERGVEEANQGFNRVEQVKKFSLIGEEWMPDSELLTPTMKLKRRGVNQRYAERIDGLYAG